MELHSQLFWTSLSHFWLSLAHHLFPHMFFQGRCPSPCHFFFPQLPVQAAQCLFQALKSHDCMFGRQLFLPLVSLQTSSFSCCMLKQGPPAFHRRVLPTRYHLKSLGYIQICAQGSSLIFHLYLQTWRELLYRDTETPAYSIPSTYPYCLLGHISCFLPYISTLKSSGRTQTLCSDVWITSIHSLGGRTGCFSATEKYNVYLWQTFFFPYVPHKYLGSSSDPCSWGFPAAQNCGWHVTRQRCKSSCQLQKFSRSRGLAKSTLPGGSWVLWLSEARAALHFVVASRCRRVCVYLLSPIQGFRD